MATITRMDTRKKIAGKPAPASRVKAAGIKRAGQTTPDLYGALKRMAVIYDFKPGDRVNELELAATFGISRSPVREALNRLVAEHFLKFVPNRGFYVRELERQDVYDLYELRKLIEVAAVDLAIIRAADADIDSLQAYWSDVIRKSRTIPTEELVLLDEEFHIRLAGLSGNSQIVESLRSINARIHFVRWVDLEQRQGATYDEHKDLLAALKARNSARCRAILESHISRRMEEIVHVIQAGVIRLYAK